MRVLGDRDPTTWVIVPDVEGPHSPELYSGETFALDYVGTGSDVHDLAFRCYERLAAPGICITAHCAYNGHSALYWARWCGAGETLLSNRPDIVASAFRVPPVPMSEPAGQGRGIVLTPNPYWHADLIPPRGVFFRPWDQGNRHGLGHGLWRRARRATELPLEAAGQDRAVDNVEDDGARARAQGARYGRRAIG